MEPAASTDQADPVEYLIIQSSTACPTQSVLSTSLFLSSGLCLPFFPSVFAAFHISPPPPCPLTTPSSSLCHLFSTSPPFLCHTRYIPRCLSSSSSTSLPLTALRFLITPTKMIPFIHFNDYHTI